MHANNNNYARASNYPVNSNNNNNNNNYPGNYRNNSNNAAYPYNAAQLPRANEWHAAEMPASVSTASPAAYYKTAAVAKNQAENAQVHSHNYGRSANKFAGIADGQPFPLENHARKYANSSTFAPFPARNFSTAGRQLNHDHMLGDIPSANVVNKPAERQSLHFDNYHTHQHYLRYHSYHNNKLPNSYEFSGVASAVKNSLSRSVYSAFAPSTMDDNSKETPFIIDALDELSVNTAMRLQGGQQPDIFEQKFNVLREKVQNNNASSQQLVQNWLGDAQSGSNQVLLFGDDGLEKRKNQASITNGIRMQNTKKKLRTRSASEMQPLSPDGHHWQTQVRENNNVQSKPVLLIDAKATTETPPKARLPEIPKDAAKKRQPPRVLLYNTRSPYLSSKQSSSTRLLPDNAKYKSPVPLRKSKLSVEEEAALENRRIKLVKQMYTRAETRRNKPRLPAKSIDDVNYDDDYYSDVADDDDDDGRDPKEDDDIDDVDNISKWGSDEDTSSTDSEETYRLHAYKIQHAYDRVAATQSCLSSQTSEESIKNPESLLTPSLFPNMPPYLCFSSNTSQGPRVPAELHRILKWRVTSIMPKVVRCVLSNSGMRMLKKTNEWIGVWGKHLKAPCFRTIRPYQKINHLPGSFKIGRKDSCWKNLQKQMRKHGSRDFGFMPKTFVFPGDQNDLRKSWPKYAQKNYKWIIKPPASARGFGIKVVSKWAQIPKRRPLIVQRYIERPLLINGSKFDLRLYVLVTSINPLRVYLYQNGLARFAAVKYSDKTDTLNDRCMHLTNYSINKFSSNYSKNEDVNACHGHKWTIKSLFTYLANRGIRTDLLWETLRGLVLRTIMAGENTINNMIKMNVESRYSVYELFGFDVLLDADLVPWLLEVNISPSLHSELPLDSHVKAPLVQGVLNAALFNVPPKLTAEKQRELAAQMNLPYSQLCYDKRLYISYLSRAEKIKHNQFTRKIIEDREEYISAILERLTPDDVRCLVITEDELARSSPLERIFPTKDTHKFLKYTEQPRYYNRLLDAWEERYSDNRTEGRVLLSRLCEDKYHLEVPVAPVKKTIKYRTRTIITMNRFYRLNAHAQFAQANKTWTIQKMTKIINANAKAQIKNNNQVKNDDVNDDEKVDEYSDCDDDNVSNSSIMEANAEKVIQENEKSNIVVAVGQVQ